MKNKWLEIEWVGLDFRIKLGERARRGKEADQAAP
jgi:hypothetical protein